MLPCKDVLELVAPNFLSPLIKPVLLSQNIIDLADKIFLVVLKSTGMNIACEYLKLAMLNIHIQKFELCSMTEDSKCLFISKTQQCSIRFFNNA